MKAKDYAKAYLSAIKPGTEVECLVKVVLVPLTVELADLVKARGVQSESAALACFREINQRYVAFTRYVMSQISLKQTGWKSFLQEAEPDLWNIIQAMAAKEKAR